MSSTAGASGDAGCGQPERGEPVATADRHAPRTERLPVLGDPDAERRDDAASGQDHAAPGHPPTPCAARSIPGTLTQTNMILACAICLVSRYIRVSVSTTLVPSPIDDTPLSTATARSRSPADAEASKRQSGTLRRSGSRPSPR